MIIAGTFPHDHPRYVGRPERRQPLADAPFPADVPGPRGRSDDEAGPGGPAEDPRPAG